jgi:glycosyltransferase involved in cell wall biosynthesis
LNRAAISVVYNPVVGPEIARHAEAPLDHPWFSLGQPPVVLAAGRLSEQKDFATLLRAFAVLRGRRPARLVVLGGTPDPRRTAARIAGLADLARSLNVAEDVALPGAEPNPFRFMARAAVFALSSAWEGFGNVLVEAMACGCPVVSTDCPSGPAEILDRGRFGPLVHVGDSTGMAAAIERMIDMPTPKEVLTRRAAEFSLERAADGYLRHLLPGAHDRD